MFSEKSPQMKNGYEKIIFIDNHVRELMCYVWVIVAILLFIAEIFIPAFYAAIIGVGCLLAGISSLCGGGMTIQLLTFSIGTLLSAILLRPLMMKFAYRNSKGYKTNVDALIGKTGRVIETIDCSLSVGEVFVGGEYWKAVSITNENISVGSQIIVVDVDVTILKVKPLN
jgi:membrane protein implicated in regulation of membrane protease activity